MHDKASKKSHINEPVRKVLNSVPAETAEETARRRSAIAQLQEASELLEDFVHIPRSALPAVELLDEDTELINDEFPINISGDISAERFAQAHYHLALAVALQAEEATRSTGTQAPLAEAA